MELFIKIVAFISVPLTVVNIIEAEPIREGTGVVSAETYPFMASLRLKKFEPPQYYCGAAIIAKRFVLTAAHCIENKRPVKFVLVAVGTIETEAVIDANKYDIEAAIMHKNYPENGLFDIGLIKVTRKFQFSETVGVIPLDYLGILASNDIVTVTAFGNTGRDCKKDSKFLQKLDMRVDMGAKKMLIMKSTGNSQGMCRGDSGSPIFHTGPRGDKVLVGIVFEGEDDTMYGMRVEKFFNWVFREQYKLMSPKERKESRIDPRDLSDSEEDDAND